MKRFLLKCLKVSLILSIGLWVTSLVLAFVFIRGEEWVIWVGCGSLALFLLTAFLVALVAMDCPSCKTERVFAVSRASTYLGNDIYLDSFKCRSCGYEWKIEREYIGGAE